MDQVQCENHILIHIPDLNSMSCAYTGCTIQNLYRISFHGCVLNKVFCCCCCSHSDDDCCMMQSNKKKKRTKFLSLNSMPIIFYINFQLVIHLLRQNIEILGIIHTSVIFLEAFDYVNTHARAYTNNLWK